MYLHFALNNVLQIIEKKVALITDQTQFKRQKSQNSITQTVSQITCQYDHHHQCKLQVYEIK